MLRRNDHPDRGHSLSTDDAYMYGREGLERVARWLGQHRDHQPTPLLALPALASRSRVSTLHVKDEGQRMGLGSFKALGGAYAVAMLVLDEAARRLGQPVSLDETQSPAVRSIAETLTFGCATDGNHGRSVAAGAQLIGARSAIFVHQGVSDERVAAIARFGAEIIRVTGTYDDSVREAARRCAAEGWIIVSDTSWPGYERVPRLVMQGYTAMAAEILAALPEPPTHVFLQAGVGGMAAAVAAHFALVLGADAPKIIVAEPLRAACLMASLDAGRPVKIRHGKPTVMAMLECYEASAVAWGVLSRLAAAFMTVDEEEAVAAMRRLAYPEPGDPRIVAGESGGAGLAAFLSVADDAAERNLLGIGSDARILVINSEGATDTGSYRDLVGASPEAM